MKILVVEDDTIANLVAKSTAQNFSDDVMAVSDGHSAIKACQETFFDLILTDLGLPDMTGIEVTKVIRQLPNYKDAIIIAVTAHEEAKRKEEALASGMNDYLNKPMELKKLESVIQKFFPEKLKKIA